MRAIELTRGQVAIVDDEDFNELAQYRWKCCKKLYAYRYTWDGIKVCRIYMHREIMKATKGVEVDHKNLNKLDNRRENLRLCTRTENARNIPKGKRNTSGFKGVFFQNRKNPWRARIRCGEKSISLGSFKTPEEAASAYNAAATRLHGEFSNINLNIPSYGSTN